LRAHVPLHFHVPENGFSSSVKMASDGFVASVENHLACELLDEMDMLPPWRFCANYVMQDDTNFAAKDRVVDEVPSFTARSSHGLRMVSEMSFLVRLSSTFAELRCLSASNIVAEAETERFLAWVVEGIRYFGEISNARKTYIPEPRQVPHFIS